MTNTPPTSPTQGQGLIGEQSVDIKRSSHTESCLGDAESAAAEILLGLSNQKRPASQDDQVSKRAKNSGPLGKGSSSGSSATPAEPDKQSVLKKPSQSGDESSKASEATLNEMKKEREELKGWFKLGSKANQTSFNNLLLFNNNKDLLKFSKYLFKKHSFSSHPNRDSSFTDYLSNSVKLLNKFETLEKDKQVLILDFLEKCFKDKTFDVFSLDQILDIPSNKLQDDAFRTMCLEWSSLNIFQISNGSLTISFGYILKGMASLKTLNLDGVKLLKEVISAFKLVKEIRSDYLLQFIFKLQEDKNISNQLLKKIINITKEKQSQIELKDNTIPYLDLFLSLDQSEQNTLVAMYEKVKKEQKDLDFITILSIVLSSDYERSDTANVDQLKTKITNNSKLLTLFKSPYTIDDLSLLLNCALGKSQPITDDYLNDIRNILTFLPRKDNLTDTQHLITNLDLIKQFNPNQLKTVIQIIEDQYNIWRELIMTAITYKVKGNWTSFLDMIDAHKTLSSDELNNILDIFGNPIRFTNFDTIIKMIELKDILDAEKFDQLILNIKDLRSNPYIVNPELSVSFLNTIVKLGKFDKLDLKKVGAVLQKVKNRVSIRDDCKYTKQSFNIIATLIGENKFDEFFNILASETHQFKTFVIAELNTLLHGHDSIFYEILKLDPGKNIDLDKEINQSIINSMKELFIESNRLMNLKPLKDLIMMAYQDSPKCIELLKVLRHLKNNSNFKINEELICEKLFNFLNAKSTNDIMTWARHIQEILNDQSNKKRNKNLEEFINRYSESKTPPGKEEVEELIKSIESSGKRSDSSKDPQNSKKARINPGPRQLQPAAPPSLQQPEGSSGPRQLQSSGPPKTAYQNSIQTILNSSNLKIFFQNLSEFMKKTAQEPKLRWDVFYDVIRSKLKTYFEKNSAETYRLIEKDREEFSTFISTLGSMSHMASLPKDQTKCVEYILSKDKTQSFRKLCYALRQRDEQYETKKIVDNTSYDNHILKLKMIQNLSKAINSLNQKICNETSLVHTLSELLRLKDENDDINFYPILNFQYHATLFTGIRALIRACIKSKDGKLSKDAANNYIFYNDEFKQHLSKAMTTLNKYDIIGAELPTLKEFINYIFSEESSQSFKKFITDKCKGRDILTQFQEIITKLETGTSLTMGDKKLLDDLKQGLFYAFLQFNSRNSFDTVPFVQELLEQGNKLKQLIEQHRSRQVGAPAQRVEK